MRHREWVPAILAIAAFAVGTRLSPFFLDGGYLLGATSLHAEAGFLVLGMTLVIVAGQIDLSVASMMALVAAVVALMLERGVPTPIALVGGLALGTSLGTVNGLLVSRLKLPSFVVTLATMAIFRGVAQVLLGPQSKRFPPEWVGVDYWRIGPLPVPLALLITLALGFAYLLHRTVTGQWIFATGTGERASRYAGVPVERVQTVVFALSGLMAGVAGMLIGSRLGVARFDHARGLEVDVITAVVVGGTAISGGTGSILGSMLALLLIAILRTGMGLANVPAEYQLAAVGSLLILAVLAGNLGERLFRPRAKASP